MFAANMQEKKKRYKITLSYLKKSFYIMYVFIYFNKIYNFFFIYNYIFIINIEYK